MRLPVAALLALLALLAACDTQDTQPDRDPNPQSSALFTAEVTGPSGTPVEGLDLYVGYPLYGSTRVGAGSGTVGVYPNPSLAQALVYFEISEAQRISIRLFDLAGTLVGTVADEALPAGSHQRVLEWNAFDDGEGGVYRLVLDGETFEAETYVVHSTYHLDFEFMTFYLGTTDAEGRVVVDDSTRFSSLYENLPEITVTNEIGANLGTTGFSDEVELLLVNPETEQHETESFTLRESGNEAALTWNP